MSGGTPTSGDVIKWMIKMPLYLLGIAFCAGLMFVGYTMMQMGRSVDTADVSAAPSVAMAQPIAGSSKSGLNPDNVTAEDWDHLPVDVDGFTYNKAKKLHDAKMRAVSGH